MSLLIFYLWIFGAGFLIGLSLARCRPRRDSEGYQLMLFALTWPFWIAAGAYFRLVNWVLLDLADLDRVRRA